MSEKNDKGKNTKENEMPMFVRESAPAYNTTRWKRQGEYTLDDYFALPEDEPVELIDGVIYDLEAPFLVHQDLLGAVFMQLAKQINKKDGPCKVYVSPANVSLGEDRKTMVQPDVFILCERDKRRKWGIQGAPDFIMEILSPSTRRKDMTVKYRKYKSCGVREYWMLDVENRRMIICDLECGAAERIAPLKGKEGLLIYQGEVKLDLDEIAALIEEYELLPADDPRPAGSRR